MMAMIMFDENTENFSIDFGTILSSLKMMKMIIREEKTKKE